jgi:hypothetical protein
MLTALLLVSIGLAEPEPASSSKPSGAADASAEGEEGAAKVGESSSEPPAVPPDAGASKEVEAPLPSAEDVPMVEVMVALTNGVSLNGRIAVSDLVMWEEGTEITLNLDAGGSVTVAGNRIQSLINNTAGPAPKPFTSAAAAPPKPKEELEPSARGFAYRNAAASRYLYAPSAYGMEQGQGYISQKLFFTSAAYALTDNWTILGGTFTYFPPVLTILGTKYSFDVSPTVSIAVGGESFITGLSGFNALASIAFVNVTYGDEDRNITFGQGVGEIFDSIGFPTVIGACYRLTDRHALITENWFVLTNDRSYAWDGEQVSVISSTISPNMFIGSAAVRVLGRRSGMSIQNGVIRHSQRLLNHRATLDIGIVVLGMDGDAYGPIPWLDWAWSF